MPSRPPGATVDGCDMSQHIKDGAALANFTVPGGKKMEFVVRYTSVNTPNNPQKQLVSGDITQCRTNGLSLVLVHEEGEQAALGSYAAGAADAAQGIAVMRSFNMPPNTPLHCAIDFDARGPDVVDYVRGFGDKLGPGRRGAYGGRKPLRYLLDLGLLDYAWQTYAWSLDANGNVIWTPGITAAQWKNTQSAGGNTVDFDSAFTADYGQLGPNWTSTDRDVNMARTITDDDIAAFLAAFNNQRVDGGAVPPPTGTTVTRLQAERNSYYRVDGLANTFWPAVLTADGTHGKLVDILAQSQSNGGGISDLKTAVANITAGAVARGVTLGDLAAVYDAAAAEARALDPTTPAPTT